MKFLVNKDNNFDMVGGGTNLELDTNTIGLGLKTSAVSIPSYDELFNAISQDPSGESNPNLIYIDEDIYLWKVSNSLVDFAGTIAVDGNSKYYFDRIETDDELKADAVLYTNESGIERAAAFIFNADNSELNITAGTYITAQAVWSGDGGTLLNVIYSTFIGYHSTVHPKFLSPEMPLSSTDGKLVIRVKDGVATLAFHHILK